MFDFGVMELLLIGVVALIVVGPKDLPVMFRNVGRFVGRMRGMARDFQRAMDDAAEDAGVKGLDRDIRKMTSAKKLGLGEVQDAARAMGDWSMEPKSKMGPETARMAGERAEAARRIREAAAERATARKAAPAAAAAAAVPGGSVPAAPVPSAPETPAPAPRAAGPAPHPEAEAS